ncbi:hypothetical protein N7457_000234 [Penicillium paradoxum]|uniref:uncharacterized protein n=1 Tax=Penicillium paradoxum TaxID=176176 RepID=UPI0025485A83|nr:uncharacterized protein N7457_000234 [Penicillium paradoxum]KAJ5793635.1 hypothetical protein N7457_000234 [Penicillium paradoxum]
MPFFKDLRRRSKATFHKTPSHTVEEVSGKSSSTIDTSSHNSITPPSSIRPTLSTPSLPALSESDTVSAISTSVPSSQRLAPGVTGSQRNSVIGSSSSSVNGAYRSQAPVSPYAPRLVSVADNSWVNQKVLLVYGQIGDPRQHPLDGNVTVYHHQDNFPSTGWPVTASHFKVLVHLVPDSDGTYDAVPERIEREGNGLDIAVRKYRMAAYLWQAFTGEQMFRNNFGRRCFRFEEEWQSGSLSRRDSAQGQMRNEAKIHIVRTEKTVAELRDLNIAQQNDQAGKKDELFNIAKQAVRNYFQPKPGQKQYVSVLLLDSHWDTESQMITGHAALGSDSDDIKMAMFGSHCLQSYPSCLEEVVDAFSDCTRTDTNHVANDSGDAGSSWEAANLGIGAHLHELGHLFGCPHQESGVMLRDYVRLNRTFLTREPFSTRTKAQGLKICLPNDECGWHRLDALRFRFHPSFRLPSDPCPTLDDSVQVWPVENGKILFTASSGIAFMELYAEGDTLCHNFIEYLNSESSPNGLPRQVAVTEIELRQRVYGTEKEKKKNIRLVVCSGAMGSYTVENISDLKSKNSLVKLPKSQSGFKSGKLGQSAMEGSEPQEVLLECAFIKTKLLTSIKIYHGSALDGLEFCYEDATSQLFGKRGGKPGGDEFVLDTRRGEILLGFYVRAGLWIDGIEILTSLGRKSGIYGNATGGSGHTLIPPLGYKIAGLAGSCAAWVDGFSLIIQH